MKEKKKRGIGKMREKEEEEENKEASEKVIEEWKGKLDIVSRLI